MSVSFLTPSRKALLYSSWNFYLVPALYFFIVYTIKETHNPWLLIFLIYTILPALDQIFTVDKINPTKEESEELENQMRFKIPLYMSLFLDWFATLWLINFMITTKLTAWQTFGILFGMGNMGASNINIAHELMHKDNAFDKFWGMITLSKNMYMHFYVEHLHGHHKNVATPIDPASSRYNQTLYSFLPQTLIGGFKSAWNYEKIRLLEGKKKKTVWTYENRFLLSIANSLIMPVVICYFYGVYGTFCFLVMAAISVLYLEAINYIEHYGLRRKEIKPGVYEKINIKHSWNTPHRISNYLLFKLQRHSDHHENGLKPYQILCAYDDSPQMPHGYIVMILLCFVPSVWFSVMNEYTEKYNNNEKIPEELINKMNYKINCFIIGLSIFCIIGVYLGF